MSSSRPPSHDHPHHDPRPYQYHRPQHLDPDLFVTHDDVEAAVPSPPYRRVPSTSQVLLESYPEQSPAYRSRSNTALTEIDMSEDVRGVDKQHDFASKGKQTVHYPEDIPPPPPIHRFDTDIGTTSRASSIAGTDDEYSDDDYDWSGEEDLVDEEAKFEHAMGVKKKRRFGCIKYVSYRSLELRAAPSPHIPPFRHADSSHFFSPLSSARLFSPASSSPPRS